MKKLFTNKLFYPTLVLTIFIVGQLISTFTVKEFFPFGPYRMYSYGFKGDNVEMIRIYCVFPDVHEELITNLSMRKVESSYIDKIETNQDPLIIRKTLDPLWTEVKDRCMNLKVYKLYWHKFIGPNRDKPDTKELIFQYVE